MPQTRNDFLKLIAAVLMAFDHIGAIFFPQNILLRIPGRISFPIFAYYTAMGACHTQNIKKMLCKILIVAFITQPIYRMILPGHLNIMFTMFYGAFVVYLWNRNEAWSKNTAFLLLVASVLITPLDYGWYGVVTIFLFSMLETHRKACFIAQAVLQVVYFAMGSHVIQMLSIFAIPLLFLKRMPHITLPKYFFYVFYPLHLGILLVVRFIF